VKPITGRVFPSTLAVVIVRATLLVEVPTFTAVGENEHCAPAGNPEQAKATFEILEVALSES
jgi:hypothetical protein